MDTNNLIQTNAFPISADKHLIFCIIATLFFVLQFIRTKQYYQLAIIAAIPASLLIYINPDNTQLFNSVGILEGVLLLIALLLSVIQNKRTEAKKKAEAAQEQAEAEAAEAAEAPAADAQPADDAQTAEEQPAEAVQESAS